MLIPVLRFKLRKSETDRQQSALFAYRPGAREVEALAGAWTPEIVRRAVRIRPRARGRVIQSRLRRSAMLQPPSKYPARFARRVRPLFSDRVALPPKRTVAHRGNALTPKMARYVDPPLTSTGASDFLYQDLILQTYRLH